MSTGLPAEPGSREPELGHLIAALTTAAHPDEHAGRDAALDAFRAVRVDDHGACRRARFAPPARSARLTAAAAAAVSILAGVTAAAYAAALPAPVQHIAYSVLAPLGVPHGRASPPIGGQPTTLPVTTGHSGRQTPQASRTPDPADTGTVVHRDRVVRRPGKRGPARGMRAAVARGKAAL